MDSEKHIIYKYTKAVVIATEFGVSSSLVRLIRKGTRWAALDRTNAPSYRDMRKR